MATSSILVLDFDGTMTDAEAEGVPFRTGYLEDLCTLVGRPARDPEVTAIALRVEAALFAAPASHPFLWNGRAVAPATVDPYLRMVPIAGAILDQFGAFANPTDRGRLTGGVLYKYNYKKTHPVFRAHAAEALARLADTNTWVVTNSDTEAVAAKIVALGQDWLAPRVRGSARKFDVEDTWAGAPAELALPGLGRPVLLRRKRYFDALTGLLAGASFENLCVIGDIFELDLAMPLALGARIGLVASDRTPAYERAFVAAHPRGRIIEDLADIPAYAFG